MSKQKIATSTNGTLGQGFKFAAATAAVIVMMVFTVGIASAGTPASNASTTPQNVNVVNTPTVSVGNTVNVNVANTPAVSISGTPNVNANVQFPASQVVTVTPGSSTSVGRLASQHVLLGTSPACPTLIRINPDNSGSCFDIANYPGQALVITDVSWEAVGTAGNTCLFVLRNSTTGATFYGSRAVAAADGIAAKTEHMTSGLVMTVNPMVDFFSCSGDRLHWLQGYLVPNQ